MLLLLFIWNPWRKISLWIPCPSFHNFSSLLLQNELQLWSSVFAITLVFHIKHTCMLSFVQDSYVLNSSDFVLKLSFHNSEYPTLFCWKRVYIYSKLSPTLFGVFWLNKCNLWDWNSWKLYILIVLDWLNCCFLDLNKTLDSTPTVLLMLDTVARNTTCYQLINIIKRGQMLNVY